MNRDEFFIYATFALFVVALLWMSIRCWVAERKVHFYKAYFDQIQRNLGRDPQNVLAETFADAPALVRLMMGV